MFLTLVLFPSEILSIFGKSFVAGSTALVLLACSIMADVSTGQCGIILDMTGRTGWKLVNAMVRLGLSLGLSALLIPRWGLLGAAVSVLITVSTINLMRMLQVFFSFHLLPYNASFAKPIAAGLAALLAAVGLGYVLPGGPLSVLLQIVALFAVYVAAIVTLGLAPEDRVVLARLRKRLRGMVLKERKP
jgi:O-antigen/teichoic acid export membrane protein